jgi:hypothetical protein
MLMVYRYYLYQILQKKLFLLRVFNITTRAYYLIIIIFLNFTDLELPPCPPNGGKIKAPGRAFLVGGFDTLFPSLSLRFLLLF